MKVFSTLFIFLILTVNVKAELRFNTHIDSVEQIDYLARQRKCKIIGFTGIALTHAALYQLWYKGYPSSSFHFFNDNHEWLQMDKFGHMYSSYYLGVAGIEAAKWSGVPVKHQWKWALFGSFFQDPIEIWDGFSSAWGASAGDLLANTLGTALVAGQHALWQEQKVKMKFSYSPSVYPKTRPNVLGSNFQESLLKDYNAQTYWLSYFPKIKKQKFVGFSLGYGADGMLGGDDNIWTDQQGMIQNYSHVNRYRQYYLALDFNFKAIKTKRESLKLLFYILDGIKFPSPALEFSQNKFKAHWLKF
jgi:hypothetical protein